MSHVAAGRTVYSNINWNLPAIDKLMASRFGVTIEHDQLLPWPEDPWHWHDKIRWGTVDSPVLVVIDEAQLYYNSRDWAITGKKGKEMLSFLTQSRRAFVDIIYITQEVGNIDKQFRVLCQFIWSFRDMKYAQVPIIGFLVGKSFFFTKMDYGGAKIDSGMIPKEQAYFDVYDSYAWHDPAQIAKAQIEQQRAIARRQVNKLSRLDRARAIAPWLFAEKKEETK